MGLASLRLPWAGPFQNPLPPCPSCLVALMAVQMTDLILVVRRRVELLFRE